MEPLLYVFLWVSGSVVVGLVVGYYLGRQHAPRRAEAAAEIDRATMLKALVTMLESTEQLSCDVDTHNVEIAQVGRRLYDMKLTGEMLDAQHKMLDQIGAILKSNLQLEEDLQYARFRMEEQAQELDRTRREARTDALSGVANRKAFDEALHYMLTNWKRTGEPFSVMLLDVDHFKWINDTHGHQAGDYVVCRLGEFLKDFVRETDFVARYGGDEFAILLAKTTLDTAHQVAERLRQVVSQLNFDISADGERVSVTFSVGVAAVQNGDSAEKVFKRADDAVYRSKDTGRNKVHVHFAERGIIDVGALPGQRESEFAGSSTDDANAMSPVGTH